jgi:Domain of unknown function (DUF1707)
MSASRSRVSFLAATRRRGSYSDLRISDAERAEVAELLATHYGDGRLDQAEFDQRLDQAMRAKTYRDLSGLLADLPPVPSPGGPAGPTRARSGPRAPPGNLVTTATQDPGSGPRPDAQHRP